MTVSRIRRMPLACSLALVCGPLMATLPAAAKDSAVAGPGDLRLCGAEAKTSDLQELALYERNGELRVLVVPAAELADELAGVSAKSGSGCAKATAAGLSVQFPGQDPTQLSGPVSFFSGGQTFGLLDPVLCESYGSGGLTLRVGDSNGAMAVLPGWTSVSYDLGSRRITPTSMVGLRGPLVQCHAFAYDQLIANPPSYGEPGIDEGIFRGRFENRGDLLVEMLDVDTGNRVGLVDVTEGLPFTYRIRVSNIGEATVQGVRIREFIPSVAPAPAVSAGSWQCVREDASPCATPSGEGAVALSGLAVAPGDSWIFTVTREVPTGVEGNRALITAAAFVDTNHLSGGGEENYEDNAVPLVVRVVGNQPPQIACTPGSITVAEDSATTAVSCTVTDADGDAINPLTVANASGAQDYGPIEDVVLMDGGNGNYSFDVTPKPDANGSVTLRFSASDEHGAVSSPHDLPVTVNAVNDAPSFSAITTTIDVFEDGSNPDGWSYVDCLAAPGGGFSCEVALSAFFFGFDGGAANESGQSVSPLGLDEFGLLEASYCGVDAPGEDVSAFFSKRPEVLPAASKPLSEDPTFAMRFSYRTTGSGSVFCDFSFADSEGASSAPVRVTFTMQPAAP